MGCRSITIIIRGIEEMYSKQMDLTLQRPNESESVALGSATMLAACQYTSRLSFLFQLISSVADVI
jgi:hypothetical protein